MAKETRRRFCIDMETEIIMRRRILEHVCASLGKKMPSWAELARRSIDNLEMQLKIECSERGIDFAELVGETDATRKPGDRKGYGTKKNRYYLDEQT